MTKYNSPRYQRRIKVLYGAKMEKIEYALFRKACECLGMTVSACLRQTSKETIIKAFGADIYDQLQLRLAAQKRYKPYEYQEQQKRILEAAAKLKRQADKTTPAE